MRSWRLAAVVADTWKGFSNLAGLSSTVTFVTVTHAILEPQPTKAKNQARRWSAVQRRASVKNRARTRACWSRRGLTGERLVVHICACVSGTAHLRGSGGRAPMSPRPVAPCFVWRGEGGGVLNRGSWFSTLSASYSRDHSWLHYPYHAVTIGLVESTFVCKHTHTKASNANSCLSRRSSWRHRLRSPRPSQTFPPRSYSPTLHHPRPPRDVHRRVRQLRLEQLEADEIHVRPCCCCRRHHGGCVGKLASLPGRQAFW